MDSSHKDKFIDQLFNSLVNVREDFTSPEDLKEYYIDFIYSKPLSYSDKCQALFEFLGEVQLQLESRLKYHNDINEPDCFSMLYDSLHKSLKENNVFYESYLQTQINDSRVDLGKRVPINTLNDLSTLTEAQNIDSEDKKEVSKIQQEYKPKFENNGDAYKKLKEKIDALPKDKQKIIYSFKELDEDELGLEDKFYDLSDEEQELAKELVRLIQENKDLTKKLCADLDEKVEGLAKIIGKTWDITHATATSPVGSTLLSLTASAINPQLGSLVQFLLGSKR